MSPFSFFCPKRDGKWNARLLKLKKEKAENHYFRALSGNAHTIEKGGFAFSFPFSGKFPEWKQLHLSLSLLPLNKKAILLPPPVAADLSCVVANFLHNNGSFPPTENRKKL